MFRRRRIVAACSPVVSVCTRWRRIVAVPAMCVRQDASPPMFVLPAQEAPHPCGAGACVGQGCPTSCVRFPGGGAYPYAGRGAYPYAGGGAYPYAGRGAYPYAGGVITRRCPARCRRHRRRVSPCRCPVRGRRRPSLRPAGCRAQRYALPWSACRPMSTASSRSPSTARR